MASQQKGAAPRPDVLPEYFADVAKALRTSSASIRRAFKTHRPSTGKNIEDLIGNFLVEHLPRQFGIERGLLVSSAGYFSKQADLLVVDHLRNAPLYSAQPERLWPVESAYALFEIKTNLSKSEIADAIEKCRRFKTLAREFAEGEDRPRCVDSLFVLWGFESPKLNTIKANLLAAVADVPVSEQPDLVLVPDRFVARAGQYLELARLGKPNSTWRRQLHEKHGPDLSPLLPAPVEVDDFGENALMAWYVWFASWLRHSGPRAYDPLRYLPAERTWGRRV